VREADVLTRLDSAAGVPQLLAAAWQALDYVHAAAAGGADPGSGLYPALMFAAVAAAEARDAAGLAPSMPAGGAGGAGEVAPGEAGELAGLAAAVAARLGAAAGRAVLPGDREALRLAAAGAGEVARLLGGAGP
jgi:hypothetical protein